MRRVVLALVAFVSFAVALPAAAALYAHADQGEAYADCMAAMGELSGYTYNGFEAKWSNPGGSGTARACTHDVANRRYACNAILVHPTGGYGGHVACRSKINGVDYFTYPLNTECDERPNETGWQRDDDPNTTDSRCYNGCGYSPVLDLDSGQVFFQPTGAVCTESEDTPPPVDDADGDGVPDSEDAFPNDPGESADSDGDGVGDNSDTAPNDPTDGEDDGEGNESDNSASGGGTCQAPPVCAGDGIQCAILYQQWRTRCVAEGVGQTVAFGSCASTEPLKCTNMTVQQCYDLSYQKMQACAAGQGGEGQDPDVQPAWTVVSGDGNNAGDEPDAPYAGGVTLGTDRIDDGGFSTSSRACPMLGSFQVLGRTIDLDALPWWCDLVAWVRALLTLLGAFIALGILMGRGV